MKKALVVDWLDAYGGAERVIASLNKMFDFDTCYSLINIMSEENQLKTFYGKNIPVTETWAKSFGKRFRYLLFFFPFLVRKIKIDPEIELIVSSSHAIAKGVKKSSKNQIHVSYFQARNLKYIWDDSSLYFGKLSKPFSPLIKWMQKVDVRAAQRPDHIVANSIFVKNWIKKNYNREATVIYPPVDISNFSLEKNKENYFVAVGRLEPYKRFDLLVEAFNQIDDKLIIVGDGTQLEKLKKAANSNITFTGFLTSDKVFKYISKAKGFVHGGLEDFGIAPIEAQACGTPVIAYGYGGVLETVIENKTGLFFQENNAHSLLKAISAFKNIKFDPIVIRRNAEKFKESNFEYQMKEFILRKA